MVSSESSLRSSLGDEDQPANVVADDLSSQDEEEQEIRHLFPCSWREFLELEPPGIGYHEYVDGFVLWRSNMVDAVHIALLGSHRNVLGLCKQTKCCAYPSVELVNDQNQFQRTAHHDQDSSGHRVESEDRNGGSSSRDRNDESSSGDGNHALSTSDPVRIQSDMRYSDLSLEHCSEDGSDNSETERDPVAKHRIFYTRPITSRLRAIIEITSHSTRMTDLIAKWRAYARTSIGMYVILDRGTAEGRNKRVIVGTLEQLQPNDRRSTSGDKEEPPSPPPSPPPNARATSSQGTARDEPPVFYYRRVYTGNEIVDCPYYCEFGLTADEILDAKYMDQLANRKRVENEQKDRRLEEMRREIEEFKREVEESKREIEKMDRENEKIEEEIEERKRREEALRRNNADLIRRLEKYEPDAAKSRKGQSSGSSSPEHKKSRKK